MIRSTWDTNVLASGAIASHGVLATLISGWRRGDFEIVTSEYILTELERTLGKPYFRTRLAATEREEFLAALRDVGFVVDISEPVPTAMPDRADNIVLATAISAETPYLVTGDREMQQLRVFRGVQMLSAREFFELVSQPAPRA